jgi:hypothetical protein
MRGGSVGGSDLASPATANVSEPARSHLIRRNLGKPARYNRFSDATRVIVGAMRDMRPPLRSRNLSA